jgi:hypothetical protein
MFRIIKSAFLFFLFTITVLLSIRAAATEININGTGYANPLGTHPSTIVEVFDKSDMSLLGKTMTDINGYYSVTLLFVGIDIIPVNVDEYARLIQNPSSDEINVELSSGSEQNWQIKVYDESGRALYSQYLNLTSGTIQCIGFA